MIICRHLHLRHAHTRDPMPHAVPAGLSTLSQRRSPPPPSAPCACPVLKHCPASCNVCTSEPLHSHVTQANEILAASKEAVDKLMLGGGCHDVTEKAGKCKEWVESGECTTNPGFMLANCAHSCGLCTPVCADHAPDCPGWAQLKEGGECDENRYFMMTTCPASCGVCSELQKHLAANRKDEL